MTGLTSFEESLRTARIINEVIHLSPGATKSLNTKTIHDVRVVMINTNFSFGMSINIVALRDILNTTKGDILRADYQPDVYPGLKIKHHNGASIFIFATGNVVMTASKTMQNVDLSYNCVVDCVIENWSKVCNNVKTAPSRSKKTNPPKYKDGYNYVQYMLAN